MSRLVEDGLLLPLEEVLALLKDSNFVIFSRSQSMNIIQTLAAILAAIQGLPDAVAKAVVAALLTAPVQPAQPVDFSPVLAAIADLKTSTGADTTALEAAVASVAGQVTDVENTLGTEPAPPAPAPAPSEPAPPDVPPPPAVPAP